MARAPLNKVRKGERPSLVNTDKANEVIEDLNGARNIEVVPATIGGVVIETGKTLFNFNNAEIRISDLEGRAEVIVSGVLNGQAAWGTAYFKEDPTLIT